MCKIINIHHKEPYTVYIGRAGKGQFGMFGNPFKVGVDGERGECIELFRQWFYSDSPDADKYRENVKKFIKPHDVLGCFCKPRSCHGDIISEYILNGYK